MHYFASSKRRLRHANVDDVMPKRFCVPHCLMRNSYPISKISLPLDSHRSGARRCIVDVNAIRGANSYVDDVT